jgi:heavy metal sensor kinase
MSSPGASSFFRSRSLRVRLITSYVVLFTIMLLGLGLVVRSVLRSVLYKQSENALAQQWSVVRGFLRVVGGQTIWAYDAQDPEEAGIVGGIRAGVYLLANPNGEVLEISAQYRELIDLSAEEIRRRVASNASGFETRRDEDDVNYILRHGVVVDGKTASYVVIGRSLAEDEKTLDQFTRYYFAFVPVGIVAVALLGWFSAGRALRPLSDVANAAQQITGTKLNTRLPERGAGDELDHLIGTFNGMVARLEQSFTQIRQFSTDVSHELRTPLTIIRGHLEVALMTAETPEQYQEAIHTALQDVERLGRVVRALLQLSQAESGQLSMSRAPLDIAGVALTMSEHLSLAAEDKGQELVIDCPEPALALADRVQIERLVTNLLSNAIKYTPVGGHINLTVRNDMGHVVLSVSDTGQGIPREHLPHIFDRFYRVPASAGNTAASPEKGLGLGLSFVNWIVKAHAGTIEVESEPGRGSRFVVTLPGAPVVPTAPALPIAESAVP